MSRQERMGGRARHRGDTPLAARPEAAAGSVCRRAPSPHDPACHRSYAPKLEEAASLMYLMELPAVNLIIHV